MNTALTFYQQYNILKKELYDAYHNNVSFKNGVAISYVKLASIYLKTDLEKAKEYLKKAEKHFLELHAISPQNAQVKQYLDIVQSEVHRS